MSSDKKEESDSSVADAQVTIVEAESSNQVDEPSMDSESNGNNKLDKADSEKEGSEKIEIGKDENKDKEKDVSEEEESDDEKEMGLLDRPVEVSGCRARKQVERLEVSFAVHSKEKDIPEGSGQKLGDCPRIEHQISKHQIAELKPLHRILFNRQGTVNDTKRNIRRFSGFSFQQDSPDFLQKKAKLEKISIPLLKVMCGVLDLERKGTKEEITMRLLQFLLHPSDSGKPLSKKKTSGRDKKNVTKKRSKGGKKQSKAKDEEEEEEGDDEVASSVNEDSDPSANEDKDEPSDHEAKKKSKTKNKNIKVKAVNKAKAKKEPPKSMKRKKEGSSDDDEPTAKKAKIPDDEEIQNLVKSILDQADLHEITMKKVIKQVYDTYPDVDLTDRKPFIKNAIKVVLKLNEEGKER